jgi:hypothetical protein
MSVPAQQLTRLGTKAAIKRGSAAARRNMNRLDQQALQELDRLYRNAAAEMSQAIMSYKDQDGNLRVEVLQDMLGQIDGILNELSRLRNGQLDLFLDQAAQLGAGAYSGALPPAMITRVAKEAVSFSKAFVGADGLQLSDRIWRLNQGAKQTVADAIQNSIIQGHSASQAVNEFLSRGSPAPGDLSSKLDMAKAETVAQLVGKTLLRDEGNARINAMRLFRTELNRAHGEAYMLTGEAHPDFGGWRFLLSPRHPALDICDMHAKVNRYGLGAGVYPDRARTPWPAHPNTLSYVEIVFEDEISDEDRAGKETRIDWLNKQPEGVQEGVLNSRSKAAALRDGILAENQIATPWKVLKVRYQNAGVDVDALAGPGPDVPSPIDRVSPVGIPVSNALEPMVYKKDSNYVLEAIDQIHGDGQLPQIPIVRTASRSYAGAYASRGDRPVNIQLSSAYPRDRKLTLIHEIGHFLDHMGVTPGSFVSVDDPRFQKWRNAVENTSAIQRLRQIRSGPRIIESGGPVYVPMEYIDYLLRTKEVWARSYTQYIITRSSDPALLRELESSITTRSSFPLPMHWEAEDFKPIAQAIDELFAELGWLRG